MLAVSMSPPVAHYPAVQRRPKLSLQTSELPVTYSTSSRGLATTATPSAAVTPTTFNTFNNTFDLTHRPSPTATTASPSAVRTISGQERISRSQSPRPKHPEATYVVNLPYGIRPILKNTLFPGIRTTQISASPRSSNRRVFFPAPKEVVFKNNIEEEIVTKIYTARHSDLFQPVDREDDRVSESTTLPETSVSCKSSVNSLSISSESSENGSSISVSSSTKRPHQLNTSEADSTKPLLGRIDTDSIQVSTPASTKTRRKWEWTLTPLTQSGNDKTATAAILASPQAESVSMAPSLHHTSKNEFKSGHLRSSSPLRQASDTSNNGSSEIAPPHPSPHATVSLPETSTSSCLTRLKLTLPLSPLHLQPQKQRRGGSLESSPSRKRKAECLDTSAVARCDSSGVHGGSGETENSNPSDGRADSGQTGIKRRERAATL